MQEITYEIEKRGGVISASEKGWTKELNYVSFNNHGAKYDIRDWSPDGKKMGKGIRLTKEELIKLRDLIDEIL